MSTEQTTERPAIVTDEHLTWLDEVRRAGKINMFGAGHYLARKFGLSTADAQTVLSYWMRSYGERHPA